MTQRELTQLRRVHVCKTSEHITILVPILMIGLLQPPMGMVLLVLAHSIGF